MRALVIASLFLLACEREPAIVVRFDVVDAGARRDLATHAVDAASAPDAATKVEVSKTAKKPDAQCKVESDCVLVPDGCCDCANGGKLVAMTKAAGASAQQRKSCKDVMCTMMVSTDPTCGKRAACVDGLCGMRDARADETKAPRLKGPAR